MADNLGGITSVVIAHRLTTIRHADKILVMKAGRVVEEGTHKELTDRAFLEKKGWEGVYAKLVSIQKKSEQERVNTAIK